MYSLLFWKAVFERSVATFLEMALILVPANFWVLEIDWYQIAIFCVLGFIVTFAKCLLAAINSGSPSVGNVEVVHGRHRA